MYQVLHQGFRFPLDYPSLRTAQLVYDREVQWTLGAILYKTRFLPLRYCWLADGITRGRVVGEEQELPHWVRALPPWQGGWRHSTLVVPHGISQPVLTPLRRDLRQESIRQAHASWLRLSFVYNHYLFFACILVVVLAIVLYLLRLRRIHRRQLRSAQLTLLWLDKVVVPPVQGHGP